MTRAHKRNPKTRIFILQQLQFRQTTANDGTYDGCLVERKDYKSAVSELKEPF